MTRVTRWMGVLAMAVLMSACATVATTAIVSMAPELLAVSLRQYGFRSEFAEAQALLKKRDWLGLSTLARQKLDTQPGRGEWWELAGYGHLQAGELAPARECFERATRLLPEEVSGWNLYAATLSRLGDARGAERALERALQTDPTSTLAWVQLGDLHAAAGRSREALRAYERALEIDQRDIFAWLGAGLLARRNGDREALGRATAALKQLYPPFAERLAAP